MLKARFECEIDVYFEGCFVYENTFFFNSTIVIHLSIELYVKLSAETDGVVRIKIGSQINILWQNWCCTNGGGCCMPKLRPTR